MFQRPIEIMKIDIEGYETLAFQKADVFFDKGDFFFVFMEWALNQNKSLVLYSNQMFDFMENRDFEPYALRNN